MPTWLEQIFRGERFTIWADQEDPNSRRPSAHFDQVVRAVCGTCNSGWMHELEDAVAPMLSPMVKGDEIDVDPDGQALIAVWTWKTMLMMELVRRGVTKVPPHEYRRFFQERALPTSGHCWLMGWEHVAGRNWASRYWGGDLLAAREGRDLPSEPNGYRATIAIGHVALQVVGLFDQHETLGFAPWALQPGFIWDLWPGWTEPAIPWPPPVVADDHGLEAFAGRYIGRESILGFERPTG